MELIPYPNVEGRIMGSVEGDAELLADIRRRIGNLDQDDQTKYRLLMAACQSAGQSISLKDKPTEKRYDIARGILSLLEAGCYDPDLVPAICGKVTGTRKPDAGRAIRDLEPRHTAGFAWICGLVANGTIGIRYDTTTDKFNLEEETSNV